MAISRVFAEGGAGGENLARSVLECLDEDGKNFQFLYPEDLPCRRKSAPSRRESTAPMMRL
jgi:formyltetrahydrofolate synthetase